MVALLCGVALVGQQGGPLFREHFKTYTGQNGWEEFVLAIEAASTPQVQQLMQGDRLPFSIEVLSLTDPIFRLVDEGLKKPRQHPAFDPATGNPIPFGNGLRMLARLAMARIHNQFAYGRHSEAVDTIMQVYGLAEAAGEGGTGINMLHQIFIEAIANAAVNTHLKRIPLPEIEAIGNRAEALLKESRTERSLELDMASAKGQLPLVLSDIIKAIQSGNASIYTDPDWYDMTPVVNALRQNPNSASTLAQAALPHLSADAEAIQQLLLHPEAEWYSRAVQLAKETSNDPGAILAGYVSPRGSLVGVMQADLKARTQARLLRIHAAIRKFDWERGRLPADLGETGLPREKLLDPLNGRQFEYRRHALGYDLYSMGVGALGRIDLKYTRDADLDPQRRPPQ